MSELHQRLKCTSVTVVLLLLFGQMLSPIHFISHPHGFSAVTGKLVHLVGDSSRPTDSWKAVGTGTSQECLVFTFLNQVSSIPKPLGWVGKVVPSYAGAVIPTFEQPLLYQVDRYLLSPSQSPPYWAY
jgi:hypothetical protein